MPMRVKVPTFSRVALSPNFSVSFRLGGALSGSSHFGVWGWCSKRPGDHGQCRGTTTEHRSSPREPHQPKLARNSDTRTLCSTPKRCNSNGAISTFEIHVGELRATFLRNHNMRRHKDPSRRHPKPGRQPKRKTTQAEDNSSTEDPRNPDSRHNRHKHGGTAPVTWRCTRYVAVHPNRRGALPTDRVQRPNKQEQTRNWHTEPLTATPLHAHLGPTGGRMGTPPTPPPALRPTPAHSDTSYTLTCEEPVIPVEPIDTNICLGSTGNDSCFSSVDDEKRNAVNDWCPNRRGKINYCSAAVSHFLSFFSAGACADQAHREDRCRD